MKDQIKKTVIEIIEHVTHEPFIENDIDLKISHLNMDSLDHVDVIMRIEKEFNIEIPDNDAEEVNTINKLVKLVDSMLNPPEAKIKSLSGSLAYYYKEEAGKRRNLLAELDEAIINEDYERASKLCDQIKSNKEGGKQ